MPPNVVNESMVQDLIDFLCEAVPSFEATLEVLELVLESNPMTSRVAKSHRRWIHICLMQQILPLQGEEREEWVAELFDGEQSTTELFAEKMCEDGIWIEEEDENQRVFYSMHQRKERNLHHYLLSPRIQRIYNTEVMEFLPLIKKESIEGSDYPPKNVSTSYKVVTPDWQKEIIAAKKQLAQSQSLVGDLQEEIQLANETIVTQNKALESKNEQLKMARTANSRLEKTWMKRYKKFFKRTWK
ncbi:hypothetical protein MFRU_030g00070 [Monilinia fructicola]|nr:hypothetical protein MFRU_030g00070 [Monilinia fructicola]